MKNLLENSIRLLSSSRIPLPLSINVHLPPALLPTTTKILSSQTILSSKINLFQSPIQRHERMSFRIMGLDSHPYSPLDFLPVLHNLVDGTADQGSQKSSYVRDQKAMASTPADVKEYPNAYAFIIDMPGLKSGDIKVQVEENVLVISGERKREEEKEGAKFVRMERRVGKFMRKFMLPENANTDAISAVCQDGVLTVTVQKLPPPEPKKPKTIEVKIA